MFKITERRLTWAFALTVVILVGNGLISYSGMMEQARNSRMLVHSRELRDRVVASSAAIHDAESSRRGFQLDRNPDDRAAFETAIRRSTAELATLDRLNHDGPAPDRQITALNRAAAACAAELVRAVGDLDRGQPPPDATATARLRRHLATLDAQVDQLEAVEKLTLVARVRERRQGINRTFVTFSLASILALSTIGTTYHLVRRHLANRAAVEQAMRDSEARFRLLFESVGEGIYGIDTHGLCTFCNPASLRILGFDADHQVLGRDMHQLIHHSHADGSPFPAHLCPIYQTFRSGEGIFGIEDFFYRADGSPVPVEYRAHAIRRGTEILGAVVTFVDIAPQRQAKHDMRLRDRALRAIGQGVFIIDPTLPGDPIIYANAAFERLTCDGPADWVGQSFDLICGAQAQAQVDQLRGAVRAGQGTAVELATPRRDGSTFWQSLTLSPVADGQGRVSHFVGVITDVSDRRIQEEHLRASEGRLRLMIESVRDYAIFSVDLSGRVSSWNSGAERLFGFAERQIIGEAVDRLFPPEDQHAQIPAAELNQARATGRADAERWLVRADGSRFLASATTTAVRDPAGELLGFTRVARDITRPKQVETELRAAKEAAELAIRAKSTFLANMGHELRTPLNAIIGYSEMLEDEANDRGIKDFVPDLERIRGAGHLLLRLVNDVLDLSRIESGSVTLHSEPYNLGDLIRSVIRAVEPLAEQRGNMLQVEYPHDLGMLRGDFQKASQSLSHLLSNAVKFTEAGTVIFRVSLEVDPADREWVVFTVVDDGVGMSRDEIARLFQPFVQADDSPSRRFGGSGLGLTITNRFCQLMGGSIEVASEPGRGSTFTMRLPRPRQAADEEPGPPPGPPGLDRPLAQTRV